jgi:hypothetical protein
MLSFLQGTHTAQLTINLEGNLVLLPKLERSTVIPQGRSALPILAKLWNCRQEDIETSPSLRFGKQRIVDKVSELAFALFYLGDFVINVRDDTIHQIGIQVYTGEVTKSPRYRARYTPYIVRAEWNIPEITEEQLYIQFLATLDATSYKDKQRSVCHQGKRGYSYLESTYSENVSVHYVRLTNKQSGYYVRAKNICATDMTRKIPTSSPESSDAIGCITALIENYKRIAWEAEFTHAHTRLGDECDVLSIPKQRFLGHAFLGGNIGDRMCIPQDPYGYYFAGMCLVEGEYKAVLVRMRYNGNHMEIYCPRYLRGVVLGKSGVKIRAIEEALDVTIQLITQ